MTDESGLAVQRPGIRGTKGSVKYVPRLVPTVSDSRFVVPEKDLVYYKDCQPIFGIKIYVGRVVYNEFWAPGNRNSTGSMDTRVNDNPCLNMQRYLKCTPIFVHVQVSN